ncbi:MAG: hypothetical protein ACK5JG_15545, partial [Pseudomonadota bacterium]
MQQRRLGATEQEAGLHHVRQRPARVGGQGRVELGQRIVVRRHHPPQRLLGVPARVGAAAPARV